MKKLLICLSLILILTLVFVGCKNKDENPDTQTEAPTTEAPGEAPTTEDPTTEDPTTELPTTEDPTTEPPVEVCTHSFPDEWTIDESVEECAGEGRLYRVCSECGEKETKADTCSFGEWVKTEGRECADADRLVKTCSKCGKTESSADGVCEFGDADITAPTCEEDGLSVKTCTKCGATEEEILNASGHVAAEGSEWNVLLAPSCTTSGTGFGECENCGEMVDVVLPATGHDANEATCSAASVCVICGTTVSPALPHNMVLVEALDPTCTEVGYIAGEYCADCGSIDSLEIPATGHDHKWVVTTAPTFSSEGVNTGTCACGDVVTAPVEKRVPALLYTADDIVAGEKVTVNNALVAPLLDGEISYVKLIPSDATASLRFLADGDFADVISVKYRVPASFQSVSANKDAYFNVNGKPFYASLTGKNVVDYDNAATQGEWTLLNIDFRKSQMTIDGVEYDMFDGKALEAIEYVLFSTYFAGYTIDVSYVAFFDTVADAVEYAATQGEVATPIVYEPTEKDYNTSLNNTNGTGEYGAPGIYLNEKNNKGVTIVDWSGRFFNDYDLTVVGSIAVEGNVQKIMYSLDGGLTWLDFAEGMATVNADGTYTAKFDFNDPKLADKTVDVRIAAILGTDGKNIEYASVLNIRRVRLVKGNLNDALNLNFLEAVGNQQSNIVASIDSNFVHYALSGKNPTIALLNDADGVELGDYMLIKYRGNGDGYGNNFDFYLTVNGVKNAGGAKYNANWFNLTLDNNWHYIIVDITNGGEIDTEIVKSLTVTLADGTVTAAKGDWLDIASVKFYDTYADAKAARESGFEFIGSTENGSSYENFGYTGIKFNNLINGWQDAPLATPMVMSITDSAFTVSGTITSTKTLTADMFGVSIDGGSIAWCNTTNDVTATYADGNYSITYNVPAGMGGLHTITFFVKSATLDEIVSLGALQFNKSNDEWIAVQDNVGKDDGKFDIQGLNIPVSASTSGANDVVALYYGDTLVLYYNVYAKPQITSITPNCGTIVDANLAKLTTEGAYTIKLQRGGANGEVIATKDIQILNSGVVGNSVWTAEEIYTAWKNFGGAQWGFDAQMSDDGTYVRLTTNANGGDGGRIFLYFAGSQWNPGWNINGSVGGYFAIKYKNNTNVNQLNVCYDGCLAPGGNKCSATGNGQGWIGTSANGWAMTVNESAWQVPAGYTTVILRFQPGMIIDIESCAFLTGWQGIGGNYDTLYGYNN